jgi:hypothetical protein
VSRCFSVAFCPARLHFALGGIARMRNNGLLITFIASLVVYTLLWVVLYRLGGSNRPIPTKLLRTPVETTTPEQRARGESSFIVAEGRQYGITRGGFFLLVLFGYVAIAAAWVVVFWKFFRSPAT